MVAERRVYAANHELLKWLVSLWILVLWYSGEMATSPGTDPAAATAALAASTDGSAGAGGGGGEPSASVFILDILKVFMVGTGILKIF